MQFTIEHEVPGRIRVKLAGRVPEGDVGALERVLIADPHINRVSVYPRVGSVAVHYGAAAEALSDSAEAPAASGVPAPPASAAGSATQTAEPAAPSAEIIPAEAGDGTRPSAADDPFSLIPGRAEALAALAAIDAAALGESRRALPGGAVPRVHTLLMDVAWLLGTHVARRWFLPAPLAVAYSIWSYRGFLLEALRSLAAGRLDVPVLDASAICISFARGDFKTAAGTMLLLNLGSLLEGYARAHSQSELIQSLLEVPDFAQLIPGGDAEERGAEERRVGADSLVVGDLIVVRTGMPIPVDGTIERGIAMVNQSSLTGEPLAIERIAGDDVFAGTAVEEGEIYVRVRAVTESTKLRSIVSLVEQSERLKAASLARRESLADKIVPWNFLLAGIVALTTRNLERTSAALMVDYSCALKLTGAISVLTAMSQSAREGFIVKGSRYFEAFAAADTIVFDKTGTLTAAAPRVREVLGFDGWSTDEVLRFSACLEEHFPHPVARAVVNAAAEAGLKHRERHAEVEYIVAHGIASALNGARVVIGSEHFVVQDEHVEIPPSAAAEIAATMDGLSTLYLAVDGVLRGVIGVEDPVKEDTVAALADLRALGFQRIVMLTGDNDHAAARVAAEAEIAEYRANLLPEDKHGIIEELRAEGARVVMVGDGVNDSPALSAADVGVAMGSGTAIAKEVADITLSEGGLSALVALRRLSQGLERRMRDLFVQVIGINSVLLAGG
ncbi:heavy metal translocating P-type ATPase, partial [Collinsella vaginalis]|uniref:heavy metal translocating P-type ATPase n=1 Tax=Collinsella vaginalis TaxID=1870987 RepID=UPI000A26DA14